MTTHTGKKKILVLSMAYFPRFVGGAEVAIKEITDRLGDQFEFHMVTLQYDSNLPRVSQVGNVLVHRIGFGVHAPSLADLKKFPLHLNKYLFQGLAYLTARRLHRQYHYDMIWSMMAHSSGIPGALFKKTYKTIPFVLTLQEGDSLEHIEQKAKPSFFLFNLAFVSADVVQTISHFLGSWAKRMGAHRVVVIPNGVDLARFSRAVPPSRRAELRMRMRAKEDETLLITTSRLVPKNGIDTVIKALTLLPEQVRFAVLGDGPEEHSLRALVLAEGLDGRVSFLGEVSQEEIPEYLASADIFIRASRSEGQGISFIEAMASGLPTIGTSVGGIPDFLTDGQTGFVCEPNIPKSVARAVEHALTDMTVTRQIAERAREMVRNHYDWEVVTKAMQDLFTSCLGVVR